jgi:hypothetical protein
MTDLPTARSKSSIATQYLHNATARADAETASAATFEQLG